MNRPLHICEKHWQEWLSSAIDPDIISLNVQSLKGDEPYQRLLYNWDGGRTHKDAQWRQARKRYKHLETGGWWCSGVDILTGGESQWGCFKPNQPRTENRDGKQRPIKYEHPPNTATEIFALKITWEIGLRIAKNQGFENEYRERILQAQKQSANQEAEEKSEKSTAESSPNGYQGRIGIHSRNGGMVSPDIRSGIEEEAFQPSSENEFLKSEDSDFFQWVRQETNIEITYCEGAKKAGALLSAGCAAIALPGVWNGLRQAKDEQGNKVGAATLIPQLKAFAQPGRPIYFCFDQDSKRQTKRDVNTAIAKTAKLLEREGCHVKVITWNPAMGKGVDDLISNFGADTFHALYESADDFAVWQVKQSTQLTYPADLELNSRYFGEIVPPQDCQSICLVGGKGTGKTQTLAQLVDPIRQTGERRILLLTHRIQLGEELCKRLGIDYVTELRESETGGVFGYGLCVDSLHPKSQARFNPADWEGAWIIIDEAEQVFWHLLNSSTCQADRVKILRCLKEVIQLALSTGGKILLSDADLSDTAIDYVRALAGFDLKPWIAVNNWKPEQGWQISNYGGASPSRLVADLKQQIEQGGKHFVCVSGQKKKSQWGTQILEAHLKAKFADKKILRIDRESIADPQHPAYGCMAHLNELLPQYDVVLASPTIETGVSIDCDHFTAVWGIFQGIQTCDSVRQALARVRANVPRYIWVRKTGFSRVGNGSTSINSLLASQHRLTKGNINLLLQAGFTDPIDTDFQPESLTCWGKKAAVVNLGMGTYRATILKALQDEGHIIIDVEGDEAAAEIVEEEVKGTKETEYQSHCEAVATAASIDDKAFQELKDKRPKIKPERLQYEKGELERRYRVPITAELVKKNDENWHPQLRLHYYLTLGREHLPAREANVMRNMLDAGKGAIFKPDANRSMLGAKIALLDWLGFDRLLEHREFSSEDCAIVDIAQKAKAHTFEMRAGLGVSISEKDTPMAIAQRLVNLIGYRFPLLRKEGARGSQIRIYGAAAADFQRDEEGKIIKDSQGQAIPLADGRDEVFTAWLERDTAAAATAQQQEMGGFGGNVSELDTVVRGNKNIYIMPGVTTEGGVTTEADPAEELAEALAFCDSPSDFAIVAEAYPSNIVEIAIELQDTHPHRRLLRQWHEAANTIKVYGQMLVKAYDSGLEAVKACLKPWSLEERWGALVKFEELAPEKMERLLLIEPNWCEMIQNS